VRRAVDALLGRDADLQTLRHWLADPVIRLITLTGPGATGKARLALELAREMADEDSVHVVFLSLAAIRDAAFVARAIAESLGMADVTAVHARRTRARAHRAHARRRARSRRSRLTDARAGFVCVRAR
jgi:predicted ATPase